MNPKWKKPQAKKRVGRRRVARKSKSRSMKYADVKSFKLTCTESTWSTTVAQAAPYVQSTGPTCAIGNVSLTGVQVGGLGSLARFGGCCQFSLNYTNQISQLKTLFDRYKINGVKLRFIPEFNFVTPGSSATIPVIKFVRDYDDASIPTVGDVWTRQGPEYRFDKPVSIFVRPRVLGQLFGTGTTPVIPGASQKMGYTNMAYSGVIGMYGLKFAVKDWPAIALAGQNIVCRIEATYYVTFREQINTGLTDHLSGETAVVTQPEGVTEDVPCELQPE